MANGHFDLVKLLACLNLEPYSLRLVSASLSEGSGVRLTIDMALNDRQTAYVTDGGKNTNGWIYVEWSEQTNLLHIWSFAFSEKVPASAAEGYIAAFEAVVNVLNGWSWRSLTKACVEYEPSNQMLDATVHWSTFAPPDVLTSPSGMAMLAQNIAHIYEEAHRASGALSAVATEGTITRSELLAPNSLM